MPIEGSGGVTLGLGFFSGEELSGVPSTINFYAINGIGLGHTARLSVIQNYLSKDQPDSDITAYCRSDKASQFFSCPCVTVPKRRHFMKHMEILGLDWYVWPMMRRRAGQYSDRVVIFDSYWSNKVVTRLKYLGYKLVLVMESHKPEPMHEKMLQASNVFDRIYFPCSSEELEFHYFEHNALWRLLQGEQFKAVGPFVRKPYGSDPEPKIIFTLGGGGDHKNEDPRFRVENYIKEYARASEILQSRGLSNFLLAKGPYMNVDQSLGPMQILESMRLPDFFGESTVVVTRGAYNLSWEAIAAGARLVTTEFSAVSNEYIESRNRFLASRGYSHETALSGEAIADAILRDPPPNLLAGNQLVRKAEGLKEIADGLRTLGINGA